MIKLILEQLIQKDTVNFINSQGSVEYVKILNSFSELDVDFINIEFNNIRNNALNDCVYFSSGNYFLMNLTLDKCGDKGLSVGEKSIVKLKNIEVNYANIGIARRTALFHLAIFQNE